MPTPSGPRRRLQNQINSVQSQPTRLTASAEYIATGTPMVPGNILGRLGKGAVSARPDIGAPKTGPAAGNSVVTSDARGAKAAYPMSGMGSGQLYDTGPLNASPWPNAQVFTPGSLDSAGAHARTDAYQHGHLIAHDRHVISNTGRTTSSNKQQATGGYPNPEASGPPRPAWKMFNRTLSHQMGVDSTRGLDNGLFHSAVYTDLGRKFPLGTQGQEYSIRYGGTPGLANYRPYGTRGGFNADAPLPTVRAAPGGPVRFHTLLQQGAPGDGPQKVYGGLPWGLHSPTLPPQQNNQSIARSRLNQVKPVWSNRPLNNNSAGQSWSQQMVSLKGQQAVKLKSTQPIRQPGLNSRWLGT